MKYAYDQTNYQVSVRSAKTIHFSRTTQRIPSVSITSRNWRGGGIRRRATERLTQWIKFLVTILYNTYIFLLSTIYLYLFIVYKLKINKCSVYSESKRGCEESLLEAGGSGADLLCWRPGVLGLGGRLCRSLSR